MRGVWYKEKATRVIQPMVDAAFTVGEAGEADAHLLVDAITSASAASGSTGRPFSERRWEVGGGYRHTIDRLRIGGSMRLSHEPDYDSVFVGARLELDLADRTSVLGIGVGIGHDAISNAGAQGGLGAVRIEGDLDTVLASLAWTQILSRSAVAGVTYDISYLEGFQENPYRTAITADGLVPERHPDQRTRHAIAASMRLWVDRSATAVIGSYRFYADDWELTAHTPEVRVVQEAGDGVDVAFRYRHHRQGDAFFYLPSYPSNAVDYVTDDIKLSAFTSHTLGVKFGVAGHVIGLTGRLEEARGELVLEYVDQNNRFGNAVLAHAALTVPFEY
jgi:hypothetical protein